MLGSMQSRVVMVVTQQHSRFLDTPLVLEPPWCGLQDACLGDISEQAPLAECSLSQHVRFEAQWMHRCQPAAFGRRWVCSRRHRISKRAAGGCPIAWAAADGVPPRGRAYRNRPAAARPPGPDKSLDWKLQVWVSVQRTLSSAAPQPSAPSGLLGPA